MPRMPSYRRNRDLIVRAENLGFDATLVAQHVIHPSDVEDDVLETWSTLAALAEATERIELIGAIKPLLINPLVFAKMAGNIADICGGRLSINVVSGWFLPELEALGVTLLDHDDRYAHTREWLDTVTALWAGKQVAVGAGGRQPALARPVPRSVPPIYVGGESDPGRALAAETADVFFINGRPLADTKAVIADLRSRRASSGAGGSLRFGLSAFVIARDTETRPTPRRPICSRWSTPSAGPRSPAAPTPRRRCTRCWPTPAGSVPTAARWPGSSAATTPSPRRISAFHDAGIELFMLQFQPLETELERFAAQIIPRFR